MGFKDLVGKLAFPWKKAVENTSQNERPAAVIGKNVLIIKKEDMHVDCGEYVHLPHLHKQTEDYTFHIAG